MRGVHAEHSSICASTRSGRLHCRMILHLSRHPPVSPKARADVAGSTWYWTNHCSHVTPSDRQGIIQSGGKSINGKWREVEECA